MKTKKKKAVTVLISLLAVIVLVGADQIFKYWISTNFAIGESRNFIDIGSVDVFDLTYIRNDGAIFGSMSGQRWFLIGFTSILIILGVFLFFKFLGRSKVLTCALVLFISGGIGNLIDRVRFGSVVDMFEFKIFRFAIFNLADVFVVSAMILLMIYILFIDKKTDNGDDPSEAEEKAAGGE